MLVSVRTITPLSLVGYMYILLDVLLCSIAEYFYFYFVCILTSPYGTTRKNTQRYYTTKRLIRDLLFNAPTDVYDS